MPCGLDLVTSQHGGQEKEFLGTFKNVMKAKRRKTGDGGAKKNEKGNILEREELVVQRPSSEVSGKAQKYTRVGPCEFVQYDEEELSIEGIKVACEKHFSPSLERKGLSCDVLAGEQGPSCHSFIWLGKLPKLHHMRNGQTLGNYMFRIW